MFWIWDAPCDVVSLVQWKCVTFQRQLLSVKESPRNIPSLCFMSYATNSSSFPKHQTHYGKSNIWRCINVISPGDRNHLWGKQLMCTFCFTSVPCSNTRGIVPRCSQPPDGGSSVSVKLSIHSWLICMDGWTKQTLNIMGVGSSHKSKFSHILFSFPPLIFWSSIHTDPLLIIQPFVTRLLQGELNFSPVWTPYESETVMTC